MDICIRKAQTRDAAAIAQILRGLGWFTHLNSEPDDTTRERITRRMELCYADNSHSIYVAESLGQVVGYVAVHWLPYLLLTKPEGYVSELFVCETGRGQGIGTRLLDVVIREARERGCSRLMLLNIQSRESYQRGFYRKHGWQERPEAANFVYLLEAPGK